jgi:hypothetical protein
VAARRTQDVRILALFAIVGTLVLAGAVLLMRLASPPATTPTAPPSSAAPPAVQPAQQIDWKVKGSPTAPVLVEEWGDFQ